MVETRIRLELFAQQDDFVYSTAPFAAFVGGVGSGKTRAGVVKALLYSAGHTGSLGMITAPTYPMLRDATLRTVLEIFPEGLYQLNRADMQLKLANGSEVLFRSTDDPDHLRGPNLAYCYMDEAAQSSEEAFKILQGRLRQADFPHQLWITTTPQGYNWVYTEFAQRERPDYKLYIVSSRQNPYLPPSFIRKLEESYQEREFALQEIEGQFVVTGGRAYFALDALKAMLDDVQEPRETRLGGAVKIWKKPYVAGKYVAGGDCAWGETGAYSVLVIIDWQTGEQVAELYGRLKEDEMAQETVNLLTEYNRAYAGVENNGEGKNVVNKMVDLRYGNRMYYTDHEAKYPEKPGWQTDAGTRPVMLGELEEAVRRMRVRPKCREAVQEMMSFVRDAKGRPAHSEGAYDDHVIAWAIAWQMRKYATFSSRGRSASLRRW